VRRTKPRLKLALASAAALAALAADGAVAHAAPGAVWAPPATLAGCARSAPALAFPSDAPARQTGPGAIAWLASAGCTEGGAPELELSPLGLGAKPGPTIALRLGGSVQTDAAAAPAVVGAPFGEVAVLAPGPGGARQLLLGRAGGELRRAVTLPGGGQAALTRAYLGDVAAAVAARGRIRIALVRWFRHEAGPTVAFGIGPAPVTALALAMDYRSEVLVVWQQAGSSYARLVRNTGAVGPLQRVGPAAPRPALQAMLSDNGHGMVAWATAAGSGTGARETAVKIAFTDAHTRFDALRTVATFPDPAAFARRDGALALVRLADENVLLAWTAREGGHYRVLAGPAVFAGVRPPRTLSASGTDARLEALAPGADGEALAVWDAGAGTQSCKLLTAPGDVVLPCTAQQVPGASAAGVDAAAVEPAADRPALAWLDRAPAPARVSYVAGSPLLAYPARGYAPAAQVAARSGGGVHWLRITAAVAAGLLACAAVVVLARRRRGGRAA
jgi:hypothetical protein